MPLTACMSSLNAPENHMPIDVQNHVCRKNVPLAQTQAVNRSFQVQEDLVK